MTTNTGTAIIQAAYEDAGLCSVGQNIGSAQQARGVDRLNDYISYLSTQGMKLWLEQDITVTLTTGKADYVIGPGGDVNRARPLKVTRGYYLPLGGGQVPLNLWAREDYNKALQPGTNGAITSFYPDRQAGYTRVWFWNTPDAEAATGVPHLIIRDTSTQLLVASDSTLFPQEWVLPLRWGLASELATGQPQEIQQRCDTRAEHFRTELESFDVEDAPTRFAPSAYGGGSRFR